MPEIIFKEETHEYYVDGVKYPCVSDIVKPLSIDYSKIHEGTLNHKRDLGKAFHHAIHLFLMDDLDWDSLDENLIEPMAGFIEFWANDEFKGKIQPILPYTFFKIEEKMYHTKLHYCGTPDLVTTSAVYDWKLRPFDPIGDPLRMVGYENLAGAPKNKIVVCFKKDGCYRRYEKELEKPNVWSMFRVCLENYEENQRFAELCEKWRKSI